MQITSAEVTPVVINVRKPVRMAGVAEFSHVTAVFVRLVTRNGKSAWGCCVASSDPADAVLRACQDCAAMVPDLHPTNIEFSLAELSGLTRSAPSALCAFDSAIVASRPEG